MRTRTFALAAAVAGVTVTLLTGCSAATSSSDPAPTSTGTRDPSLYPNIVIDVCDAKSYDKGHLKGAINLDVTQQPLFSNVIKTLGKGSTYEVYCDDEGAAQEAERALKTAGLTVKNIGTLAEAKETSGLDIVKK
jgi:rhodanese-related sulfurtransferase